ANTTVFTLVNAVLFKGLPFERSEQIMHLSSNNLPKGRNRIPVSYPDFADWRTQTKKFQNLAAFSNQSMTISDRGGAPERYSGALLSTNSFSVIGQKPLLGRDFAAGEDQRAAAPVAILGYSIWKNRYGGDTAILGRTIRINGVSTSVVGVMPEGMKFPTNTDLWMPLIPAGNWEKRDSRGLGVFGRLAVGVKVAEAQAEFDQFAKTLQKEYAKTNDG